MPNQFIQKTVSLYDLPVATIPKSGQYTEGDLHGNAVRLLFSLFEHGIASGLNKDDFAEIARIYKKDVKALTRGDLNNFLELLDKLTFNKEISIRLLGDVLCDRGQNDYFTLKVLEKLGQNGVQVDILLSNHCSAFIQAYEEKSYSTNWLDENQQGSMKNMNLLIEKGLIGKRRN